jgi:hypothetical protein
MSHGPDRVMRGTACITAVMSGVLLFALGAVGCEDDGKEPDVGTANPNNAGQGGADGAGTGGTNGANGTDGTGGTNGANGTDGTGGDPFGGASGSGGSEGTPPDSGTPCSPETTVSEDELARAAVTLTSCLSGDGYYRAQTYLRGKVGGYSYFGGPCFTACLAAVTNGCTGAIECMGFSDLQISDSCGTCQGNVAILCEDAQARRDCAKYGGTCSDGHCIPLGGAACDEATFESQCDSEGRPLHCAGTLQTGPACALFGLECKKESSDTWCVGKGEACSVSGAPDFDVHYVGQVCNGARLNACVRGGLADLDCSLFGSGFSCQTSEGAYFCGTASECDPATFAKSCDGTNVIFCNAGKITRVDCTSLGFARCFDDPTFGCESAVPD